MVHAQRAAALDPFVGDELFHQLLESALACALDHHVALLYLLLFLQVLLPQGYVYHVLHSLGQDFLVLLLVEEDISGAGLQGIVAHGAKDGLQLALLDEVIHQDVIGIIQSVGLGALIYLGSDGDLAAGNELAIAYQGQILMLHHVCGHGYAHPHITVGGGGVGFELSVGVVAGEDGDVAISLHIRSVYYLGSGYIGLYVHRYPGCHLDAALHGGEAAPLCGGLGHGICVGVLGIYGLCQVFTVFQFLIGGLIRLGLSGLVSPLRGLSRGLGLAAEKSVGLAAAGAGRSGPAGALSLGLGAFDGGLHIVVYTADGFRRHIHVAAGFHLAPEIGFGGVVDDGDAHGGADAHLGPRCRRIRSEVAAHLVLGADGDVSLGLDALVGLAQVGVHVHAGHAGGGHGGGGNTSLRACRCKYALAAGIVGGNCDTIKGYGSRLGPAEVLEADAVLYLGYDVYAGDTHGNAGAYAQAAVGVGALVLKGYACDVLAHPLAAGVAHGLQAAVQHMGEHIDVRILAQIVLGGIIEPCGGADGSHMDGYGPRHHILYAGGHMAGLGHGGGIHAAAYSGDLQPTACLDLAFDYLGLGIVGEVHHYQAYAGGQVGGFIGYLHLAHSGYEGKGGIIIEGAVGPDDGAALAQTAQGYAALLGGKAALSIYQGLDLVVQHGDAHGARYLGAGDIGAGLSAGAVIEHAAQNVAAGELAHHLGLQSAGCGAPLAQHRLHHGEGGFGGHIGGGGLLGSGVAGVIDIYAYGRGDGIGDAAHQAVGIHADIPVRADGGGGRVLAVLKVSQVYAGLGQRHVDADKGSGLGFHPCYIGRSGNARGFADYAAPGVDVQVALGGNAGSPGHGGLGFGGDYGAGEGEVYLKEFAHIRGADIYLAVASQLGSGSSVDLRLLVQDDPGDRIRQGKAQRDVAYHLGGVETDIGIGQSMHIAAGSDRAPDGDQGRGGLDHHEVGAGVPRSHEHVPHTLGLGYLRLDVHQAGGDYLGALRYGDLGGGIDVIDVHAVGELGICEFVLNDGLRQGA